MKNMPSKEVKKVKKYEEVKKYEYRKEREELQKLKDKYGDDEDSTSESEDDMAESLTPNVMKGIFKTLAAIKNRDPRIYDPKTTFYDDGDETSSENEEEEEGKSKKSKPMFLKDLEREVMTKHDGKWADDESSEEELEPSQHMGMYDKEMEEVKKSFQPFLQSDDSDDDELLTKRQLTKEEEKKQDELLKFLAGEVEELDGLVDDKETADDLKKLRSEWTDPKLNEDDKFLVNFLLKKQYLDEDKRVPTYDEIVLEEQDAENDEEEFEKEELFEYKFNHRFEEPDPEFIKSYPRTIAESVRPKDTKRSLKRKTAKDRKETEKAKKREELKKLKNLKKREIEEKLKKLKEVTGNSKVNLAEDDLNEDFDPAEHDKLMKKVLGDEFYNQDREDVKPVFSCEELDDEEIDWDNWERQKNETHCEDENFNMDVDFDPEQEKKRKFEQSLLDRSRKKKKRKSAFAEALEKSKKLNPEKTFDEYIDEYYNLDYEDIIAGQPFRLRYRKVVPNDFGLTNDEIFKVPYKELNAWASVKKMSQYSTEEEELYNVKLYKQKAKKKYNILTSLVETEESTPPSSTTTKSMLSSDVSKQKKSETELSTGERIEESIRPEATTSTTTGSDASKSKRKKKKRNKKNKQTTESIVESTRPAATSSIATPCSTATTNSDVSKSKKRKRNKKAKPTPTEEKNKESTADTSSSVATSSTAATSSTPATFSTPATSSTPATTNSDVPKSRKRKRNKKAEPTMTDERLAAYKINPKKFKYFHLPKIQEK